MKNNTINKKEIEKFSKIADEWWNCLLYTSDAADDQ